VLSGGIYDIVTQVWKSLILKLKQQQQHSAPVYVSVVTSGGIYVLDLAAKIDQCAEYLCKAKWGDLDFPPPFGRDALPEVSVIPV